MNRKNIAIVTWYNSINYGTCLQAYALSQFLRNHGYHAYFIEGTKYYYGLHNPIESLNAILRKYINRYKDAMKSKHIIANIKEKYSQRQFKNSNFSRTKMLIHKCSSRADFEKVIRNTELFITGSDQIWNPNYVSPCNLLAFAQNNKKIAYASSIGVNKIPFGKKGFYKKYLSRFYKIGVREKTAQHELSKLLSKDIVTVLDPTFLLNKDSWSEIINKNNSEPLPDKKYIFCYFIGGNRDWEEQIKLFAEKNSYEIYCATSESYIIPNIGKSKPELGVEDFVNYLSNADIIATDSFHAIALSINFNKKFVVFKRFKDIDKKSQNSRIADVLLTFKLQKQLVSSNNTVNSILHQNIDYSEANSILRNLRNSSENFLINAIENREI